MELLKSFNLGVRFVLELCLLGALGFASAHLFQNQVTKWIFVIALPILAAVLWGMFIAPKSQHLLGQPLRIIVELILFVIASALLYMAGFPKVAISFITIVLLNELLLYIWKQ